MFLQETFPKFLLAWQWCAWPSQATISEELTIDCKMLQLLLLCQGSLANMMDHDCTGSLFSAATSSSDDSTLCVTSA